MYLMFWLTVKYGGIRRLLHVLITLRDGQLHLCTRWKVHRELVLEPNLDWSKRKKEKGRKKKKTDGSYLPKHQKLIANAPKTHNLILILPLIYMYILIRQLNLLV